MLQIHTNPDITARAVRLFNFSALPVDRNIPTPNTIHSPGKYPFLKMRVGDSFVVDARHVSTIRNRSYQFNTKTKLRFITRMTETGLRVWRTK